MLLAASIAATSRRPCGHDHPIIRRTLRHMRSSGSVVGHPERIQAPLFTLRVSSSWRRVLQQSRTGSSLLASLAMRHTRIGAGMKGLLEASCRHSPESVFRSMLRRKMEGHRGRFEPPTLPRYRGRRLMSRPLPAAGVGPTPALHRDRCEVWPQRQRRARTCLHRNSSHRLTLDVTRSLWVIHCGNRPAYIAAEREVPGCQENGLHKPWDGGGFSWACWWF